MDDIQALMARVFPERQRVEAERAALVATLPCARCVIGPDAQACELYDKAGCKHLVELNTRRMNTERRESRIANLKRAGLDAQILEDSESHGDSRLQMILRDDLESWTAVHAVRKALESKAMRFLVLGGEHRTGKTLAMMYACALRTDAVYIPAQRLGRINQDSARWVSAGLLCINELGREHLGGGYAASNLEELIAEREYGRKLTIFATNLPKQKTGDDDTQATLFDRYGDLFASRIRMPIGVYVTCKSGSVEAGASPPVQIRNPRAPTEVDDDRS
jgi:hypothetical protein